MSKYAPFPIRFRSMDDLKDYLKSNFEPACIAPDERLEDAHRRSGEVLLAQRLIATIERGDSDLLEGDL